jgi:S-adenosyl-L-methionine hydrolase (adenosine-forming)
MWMAHSECFVFCLILTAFLSILESKSIFFWFAGMSARTIITLTTDFGLDDIHVGVMKGVIFSINPACAIVDITHAVEPRDIAAGALALESACPYFSAGAIHVAVVDPGVGSGRRALVVKTERSLFVGPDNGIFSFAMKSPGLKAVYEITAKEYFLPDVSATFHGRDIFAPVAAHLSKGVPPEHTGRRIDDPVMLPQAVPVMCGAGALEGCIEHIDRFGNLITNVRRDMLKGFVREARIRASCKRFDITALLPSYATAQEGEPFCIIGSSGRLEISVKNSSAAKLLGACRGDSIVLKKI